MSEEEDFQKVILDALAGLRKDIDGLKIDVTSSERRVAECVDRVQKIVDGAEWEMREFVSMVHKVERARDKATHSINDHIASLEKVIGPLVNVVKRNLER
jgi:hypothetical protein